MSATNDGGTHYGVSASFRFYGSHYLFHFSPLIFILKLPFIDPLTEFKSPKANEDMTIFRSQLQFVKRNIEQIQSGVQNIQKLELELNYRFDLIGTPKAPEIKFESEVENENDEESYIDAVTARAPQKQLKNFVVDKNDREIRVFISSPFRDMQDERDLIVKKIIPKIRKICIERDLGFSYVDLRW